MRFELETKYFKLKTILCKPIKNRKITAADYTKKKETSSLKI